MIISDELELAFAHVPHAAGTSVTSWIKSHVPDARQLHRKHAPASKAPDDYFTFCIVRNHCDWIKSLYGFTVKTEGRWDTEKWEYINGNSASLSEFAVWYTQQSEHPNQDVWHGQFFWTGVEAEDVDTWFRMDGSDIYGPELLAARYEPLDSSTFPHKNKSTSSDRIEAYDPEAVQAIQDFYSDEIEFFDFSYY